MSLFFPEDVPPVIHHAIARVERRLPRSGEILVRVGSRVEPDDVVARSSVPGVPALVNVARALDLAPAEIPRAMRKEEGAKVAAGEVIARLGIIGRRSCQAPIAGTLTQIDTTTGHVTIEPEPEPLELRSQVRGLVMEVDSGRSLTIETPAASVYGVAGVGPDRFGVLRLLVTDPGEVVDADQIDARSAYAIVIAGAGITAAALERAVQEQVRGVIVGGMEVHELMAFLGPAAGSLWEIGQRSWAFPAQEPAMDPGLTLMITEGFGLRPLCRSIFELLASYDQQEALIQGATRARGPLERPRLVIPLTRSRATAAVDPPHPQLQIGAPVRLVDEHHLGMLGTLVALPLEPEPLPSGVRSMTAHVQLADGERIVVSRSAVEVLALP